MPCVVLRFHPFFVRRRAKRAQMSAIVPRERYQSTPTESPISTAVAPQKSTYNSNVFYDPLANYPYHNDINTAVIAQPSPLAGQFQNFSPDEIIYINHPRTPFGESVQQSIVQLESPSDNIASNMADMATNDNSPTIATVAPATGLARFRQKPQTGATKIKDAHQVPVAEPLNIKPARFKRRMSHDDLLNEESRLGSTIFGPIPAGHHREFFHDHNNVWIWYESWRDANRHQRQITVRYEIRPTGVYKKFTAGKYTPLDGAELHNFRKATHAYLKVIREGLYGQTAPATIATV